MNQSTLNALVVIIFVVILIYAIKVTFGSSNDQETKVKQQQPLSERHTSMLKRIEKYRNPKLKRKSESEIDKLMLMALFLLGGLETKIMRKHFSQKRKQNH